MSIPSPYQNTQMSQHYDLLPLGVCIVDRELNVHAWNKTLSQWSDISKADALKLNLGKAYPNLTQPRFQVRFREVFNSSHAIVLSPSIHRCFIPIEVGDKNSNRFMSQRTTIQLLPDQDDFAIIFIEDVTNQYLQIDELRNERKKLRRSESQMRTIIDSTPECVKLVAEDGTLLDMNRAGLDLLEVNNIEELSGKSYYDFLNPKFLDTYLEFNKRICSGAKLAMEFETISSKGTRRWVRTTAVPYELENGRFIQLALTRDITDQKENNFALRTARDEAQRANQAKSDFLANMSHEIRTPMTAIMGFAEILCQKACDEESQKASNTIKRNGEHLLAILNDILDLSKMDASKMAIVPKECSPFKIINDIVDSMRVKADSKGIGLQLKCEGLIPQIIQTDETRLRQIVLNVVGNAIKFTNQGQVDVILKFDDTASKSRLRIDVIDTGIGISEENRNNLFQPFTQADNSVSRKYGGTGLGLTISSRLAKMLDGSISVESEQDKGSRFTIQIGTGNLENVVFVDGNPAPKDSTEKKTPVPSKDSMSVCLKCQVLLVEDGPDNQRLINFMLKKAGAEVTIAEHGLEGLEKIYGAWPLEGPSEGMETLSIAQPFDIVLMDMQMPIMDGYTATTNLRKSGYTGPIIAVTAHAMPEDRQKCLDAGCDDYLTKPINKQKLLTVIQQYLEMNNATPLNV